MIDKYFNSPTFGKLNLTSVCQSISKFIKKSPQENYRLVIGSDSHEKGSNGFKELVLVGAIVIHKQGKGGRYFYQKQKRPKPHTLRDKIYTETFFSLEIAEKLLPILNKELNGKRPYELEIHVDVGRVGETRDMIKEVVGMVTGNGYTAKTKPYSFGASTVADKHI